MPATYENIATTTLNSNTSTVDFTNISQSYTDLILVVNGSTTPDTALELRVGNGAIDTGSNYSQTRLYGNGSTASSDRLNNTFFYTIGNFVNGMHIFHFMNYSNTTTNKTIINRASVSSTFLGASVNLWRSTSAINCIRVYVATNNMTSGSSFTLYGVKAA